MSYLLSLINYFALPETVPPDEVAVEDELPPLPPQPTANTRPARISITATLCITFLFIWFSPYLLNVYVPIGTDCRANPR